MDEKQKAKPSIWKNVAVIGTAFFITAILILLAFKICYQFKFEKVYTALIGALAVAIILNVFLIASKFLSYKSNDKNTQSKNIIGENTNDDTNKS